MTVSYLLDRSLHLVVPRTSNNHRARLLHASSLVYFSILVLAIQLFIGYGPRVGLRILGYAANISPAEVIRLTNERRAAQGLMALREDPVLSQAALAKGTDMLSKDYWAHVAPDGTEPWAFFADAGYSYRYAGENLARDFSNPMDAVEAWMASPSHRDNLLSDKYEDIGIAVVEGDLDGVDTTIIVQLLGTRAGGVPATIPVAEARNEVSVGPEVVPEVLPTEEKVVVYVPETSELVGELNTAKGQAEGVWGSPFGLMRVVALGMASIFLVVMVVDGVVAYRRGLKRFVGRTAAHVSFMGMIVAIVLIAKAGRIF
jgi:hypothetical protein